MYQMQLLLLLALLFITLLGCGEGGDDEGNPGATASLAWDPVVSAAPVTYTVHYGKQSVGNGSCSYENSLNVSEPFATITNLEFDVTYYFAVSAYNGVRSACSNEVQKETRRQGQSKEHPNAGGPPGHQK